jgi:hypothetical protein
LAGYPRPNIISMFKTAETKIPLEKIAVFAQILGIDGKHFLRVALLEYSPNVLEVIETTFGPQVSRNEAALLAELRARTDDATLKLVTPEQRDALDAFVATLTP